MRVGTCIYPGPMPLDLVVLVHRCSFITIYSRSQLRTTVVCSLLPGVSFSQCIQTVSSKHIHYVNLLKIYISFKRVAAYFMNLKTSRFHMHVVICRRTDGARNIMLIILSLKKTVFLRRCFCWVILIVIGLSLTFCLLCLE